MPRATPFTANQTEHLRTVAPRFWGKVARTDGCWLWTASTNEKGYGQMHVRFPEGQPRNIKAHRLAWLLERGPLPPDLDLDHLCRNPRCVNPAHLEPVTPGENTRRGEGPAALGRLNASKAECPAGHPYSGRNNRGQRVCRACRASSSRRYYWRKASK